MTFKTDHFTTYEDPQLSLYALRDSVGTPFLLLSGLEPDLKWERFITAVRLLAERLGFARHRTGRHPDGRAAHQAGHPHRTRQQQGTHRRSPTVGGRSAGPGQCVQPDGVPAGPTRPRGCRIHRPRAALSCPTDYPAAVDALLGQVQNVASLQLPLSGLDEAAAEVQAKIDEQVEASSEVAQVVAALERQYDAFISAQENRSLLAATRTCPAATSWAPSSSASWPSRAATRRTTPTTATGNSWRANWPHGT